jgi:phosphoribosylanthranilate isomerase
MSDTKIKICGLFRPCDADFVSGAKPDYAGCVFYEKSRRCVSPEDACALRAAIDPAIETVGVFVNAP